MEELKLRQLSSESCILLFRVRSYLENISASAEASTGWHYS